MALKQTALGAAYTAAVRANPALKTGSSSDLQAAIEQQRAAQTKVPEWNLSGWTTTGTGSWNQQPVLTVDGQQYRFNTPQEYISKLQELQNIPGMTGPIGQFISQFQGAIPEYTKASTQKSIQPIAPPTPVTQAAASPKPNQTLIDSEIARAQQVYMDADKLAGTGKYVGQTAQQVRDNAHQYAEGLRNGTQQPTPISGTQQNQIQPVGNMTPIGQQTPATPETPQAGSQTTPLIDPSGTKFSTGNPQLDSFLNNTWIPLMQSEVNANPSALTDPKVFAQIHDTVQKTWGPIFQNELNLAKETYDRAIAGNTAQTTDFNRQYGTDANNPGTTIQRSIEDLNKKTGEVKQDFNTGMQRIARNFQEAQMESNSALANRNVLFGGTRNKADQGLQYQKGQNENDLTTSTNRSLADLNTNQGRTQADTEAARTLGAGTLARSAQDINSTYTQAQQSVSAEQMLKEAEERTRLQNLGSTVLKDPSAYTGANVFQ